jgi:hypothetical protein
MLYNIPAVVKDVKVTKKGIQVSLEEVKFQGEQLTDFATLIGEAILLDIQLPQMRFDDEDMFVQEKAEATETVEVGLPAGQYTLSLGSEPKLVRNNEDGSETEIEGTVTTFEDTDSLDEAVSEGMEPVPSEEDVLAELGLE